MMGTRREHLAKFWGTALPALLAAGCASLPGGLPPISFPYGKPAAPPKIFVRYFPYGPSLDRRFFAPVPDYRLWTDSRMIRDLDRMGAAGVDVAVVHVSAEGFGPAFRRQRFARFAAFASSPGAARPRVMFELAADVCADANLFSTFQKWFLKKRVGGLPAYFRASDGRPVILLEAAAGSPTLRHPAIAYRSGGEWTWKHPRVNEMQALAGRRRVASVCAGLLAGRDPRGRLTWKVPRRKGWTIRAELRIACNAGAETILAASWNDFSAGDCLEPNTYDGRNVLEAFSTEIGRLRAYWSAPK